MLLSIFNTALDLIFPITCYFCHRPGQDLCSNCESKYFKPFTKTKCHVCHGVLRIPGVYIHRLCVRNSALDGLFATYILNEPLKRYIKQIKYGFYLKMLDPLKLRIKQTLSNRAFSYDLITYVPLFSQRQKWRDFNQAQHLAQVVDFRAFPLLKKFRSTKSQGFLNRNMRKMNVNNCFRVINRNAVKNKVILICDDVYTTGSTLNACARVLKEAGALKVYGYVLAIDELAADA